MQLSAGEVMLVFLALKFHSKALRKQMKAPTARKHHERIADLEALTEKVNKHYWTLVQPD